MFRILRLVLASILVSGFVGTTAADDRDAWSIVRASGKVWVRADGAQPWRLATRKVAPGTTLATSANGRVLLQRGGETMVVGPGTVMRVPADSGRLFTTVIEAAGEIEFDVDKRNVKHFSVKTPYLAAVVKGTHFTVRAGADRAAPSLSSAGSSKWSLRDGREDVDLLPGQRADVSDDGLLVFGGDDHADVGPAARTDDGLRRLKRGRLVGDGVGVGVVAASGGVKRRRRRRQRRERERRRIETASMSSVGGGNGVERECRWQWRRQRQRRRRQRRQRQCRRRRDWPRRHRLRVAAPRRCASRVA